MQQRDRIIRYENDKTPLNRAEIELLQYSLKTFTIVRKGPFFEWTSFGQSRKTPVTFGLNQFGELNIRVEK